MLTGRRAGLDVLPMVVLCGCWWPVYPEVMVRRAGDEVLGWDDAGLAGLEEPAMNLSRKCCSQSEEGMIVRFGWIGLDWSVLCCLGEVDC